MNQARRKFQRPRAHLTCSASAFGAQVTQMDGSERVQTRIAEEGEGARRAKPLGECLRRLAPQAAGESPRGSQATGDGIHRAQEVGEQQLGLLRFSSPGELPPLPEQPDLLTVQHTQSIAS